MKYTSRKIEIDIRLEELSHLLEEPHTIDQLAEITGRSKRCIYKDIAKLAYRGNKIGSKLGIYWIEDP